MEPTILDVLSFRDEIASYVKTDGSVDTKRARECIVKYSNVVIKGIHPDHPEFRIPVFEDMSRRLLKAREDLKQMSDPEVENTVMAYLKEGEMLNQSYERITELESSLTQARTRIHSLEAQLNGQPNSGNRKKRQTDDSYNYQPETTTSRKVNWRKSLATAAVLASVGVGACFGPKIFSTNEKTTFEGRHQREEQMMQEAAQYRAKHPHETQSSQRKEQTQFNNNDETQTEKKVKYGPT
ncbi:MAG: hypothetical protein AABW63_01790 [Nanoarchaeota archaeon]